MIKTILDLCFYSPGMARAYADDLRRKKEKEKIEKETEKQLKNCLEENRKLKEKRR